MNKLLFGILLLLSTTVFSQVTDQKTILKLLDEQSAAWNRGNIEDFMETYWKDDSLMFIGKSGITYGWQNTLTNYKKGYPDTATMGKLTFTILNTRKLSMEYYHVTGKWHLLRTIGNLEGYFTLLLRRINGKWVIIADHSS